MKSLLSTRCGALWLITSHDRRGVVKRQPSAHRALWRRNRRRHEIAALDAAKSDDHQNRGRAACAPCRRGSLDIASTLNGHHGSRAWPLHANKEHSRRRRRQCANLRPDGRAAAEIGGETARRTPVVTRRGVVKIDSTSMKWQNRQSSNGRHKPAAKLEAEAAARVAEYRACFNQIGVRLNL